MRTLPLLTLSGVSSSLNLNPHCHLLAFDGVYATTDNNPDPSWKNTDTINDKDIEQLITNIARRVLRHLKKLGLVSDEGEIVENPALDKNLDQSPAHSEATRASIAGKIAFGPNTGKYVTRIGSGFGYEEETPLAKGKLCFSVNGFSLHANTQINALARDKLFKLIEYMARGAISNERVEIQDNGNIRLKLKSPWRDGTSHLLFTPQEFLEKLSAIIPKRKYHLVTWHGILAPHAKLRKKIILNPENKKSKIFDSKSKNDTHDDHADSRNPVKNSSWSKLLAKIFAIDVSSCPHCQSPMEIVCAVMSRESISRYLKHQGLDPDPPPRAPARVVYADIDDVADEYPGEMVDYD